MRKGHRVLIQLMFFFFFLKLIFPVLINFIFISWISAIPIILSTLFWKYCVQSNENILNWTKKKKSKLNNWIFFLFELIFPTKFSCHNLWKIFKLIWYKNINTLFVIKASSIITNGLFLFLYLEFIPQIFVVVGLGNSSFMKFDLAIWLQFLSGLLLKLSWIYYE